VAIKDVLKHISSTEAELIAALGTAIEPKLLEDKVSSHQIVEHFDVNIKGIIDHHARKFKVAMVISTGC
jgi:inorganic pyrophosphatase/exopolyphosphatase